MSTQDFGPVRTALEADLSAWGESSGVLAQVARELASRLDAAPGDRTLTDLSRELRLVVAAIRDLSVGAGPGEVERFLASIQADEFR